MCTIILIFGALNIIAIALLKIVAFVSGILSVCFAIVGYLAGWTKNRILLIVFGAICGLFVGWDAIFVIYEVITFQLDNIWSIILALINLFFYLIGLIATIMVFFDPDSSMNFYFPPFRKPNTVVQV